MNQQQQYLKKMGKFKENYASEIFLVTHLLSGPTAMPLGHVKVPGSLPRPPIWKSCRRFCRYCVLGELGDVPTPVPTVGEVGELSPFFESSSELCISFA